MEMYAQNIKIPKNTIINSTVKVALVKEFVKNISTGLPLFKGVDNEQTLSETKRKVKVKRIPIEMVSVIRTNRQVEESRETYIVR